MSGRKALYFIFLCQAFLQETRSHMIYHVIKGAWGCFPNKRVDGSYWPSAHCLLQYTRPVNRASKALCAGSYLSYNGEESRTDDALHELKRSEAQTVSRLLIAAFD